MDTSDFLVDRNAVYCNYAQGRWRYRFSAMDGYKFRKAVYVDFILMENKKDFIAPSTEGL